MIITREELEEVECEAFERGYKKGIEVSISLFLDAIKTYDTYGYDVDEFGEGNYLVRLDETNDKDFVPYIHLDDVIKCAKGVLEQLKEKTE